MELPAHLEPDAAWREIRAELRRAVGDSTYEIWLAPLELKAVQGSVLTLAGPVDTQAWVAKRYRRLLERCARSVIGSDDIRVAFGDGPGARTPEARAHHHTPAVDEPLQIALDTLNPRYSFDQFIIGDGNHLAHAAALAVAELPGQAYNPLFLHAPSGLGKTHLLHAIGNYILAYGSGASVCYTTVEAFTNEFLSALSSRSVHRFKRTYRNVDVLLIDDVQFLASKVKTEEEFFHTFNALYANGRQLVLTCDRLPRQLTNIDERLRERFEAGLVADIKPPDFATRLAILRKRAALDSVNVADPAVLELIAERITHNIRLLEGALIRIVAYHSLTDHPIDVEFATGVLDGMDLAPASDRPSIAQIQAAVAAYYDLTPAELVSPSREARISWPRHVAIHLARGLTDTPVARIGAAFGGRNHATVLHACKKVAQKTAADVQAANEVNELSQRLRRNEADRAC